MRRRLHRRYGHAKRTMTPKARMAMAEAHSSGTIRAGHVYSKRLLQGLEKNGLLKHVYGDTYRPLTDAEHKKEWG